MSGELTRWIASTPAEREHDRTLIHIDQAADEAQARIQAMTGVAQTAIMGALSLGMVKREAALLIPEDAAKFDLIATTAAVAVAGQLERLNRRMS